MKTALVKATMQRGCHLLFGAILSSGTCIGQVSGTSPEVLNASSQIEQPARITAFLADKDGTRQHDFPAWNEYKIIAGDTPVSRELFADMLKAEPVLCDAIGGDAGQLQQLFGERVIALKKLCDQRPGQPAQAAQAENPAVTWPQIVTLALVAARPEVTEQVCRDWEIRDLVASTSIMARENKVWPAKDWLEKWSSPDGWHSAVKCIMTHWAVRPAVPGTDKGVLSNYARFDMAYWLSLEEAKPILMMEVLHGGRGAILPACFMAIALERKDCRPLLESFLSNTGESEWIDTRFNTRPQVRDVAMSTILQLSGEKPEDYGFAKSPVRYRYFPVPAEVYHFRSPKQRQEAFQLCAQNFRTLGLQEQPHWTPPGFDFVKSTGIRGGRHGGIPADDAPLALATSPDGKLRLAIDGEVVSIVEVTTGKTLAHLRTNWRATCCSFSPDGKYIVTGCGFYRENEHEKPDDVGEIVVWDAATGKRVEEYGRNLGTVRSVVFDADCTKVCFDAADYSDGDGGK